MEGITGHSVSISGVIRAAPIRVGDSTTKVDLLVIERTRSPHHDVLLGTDWIALTKAHINLSKKVITFTGSTQPIRFLETCAETTKPSLANYIDIIYPTASYQDPPNDSPPDYSLIPLAEYPHLEKTNPLQPLLTKYQPLFTHSLADVGRTSLVTHRIRTTTDQPIRSRPYRLAHSEQQSVRRELDLLLELGLITPSQSDWTSPIILVPKPKGENRLCVDYRRLNAITVKDAYPLPLLDDILDTLSGSNIFSCLDLKSGYWQVTLNTDDRHKAAFTCKFGIFEWTVMPFGLCNAPSTFQRLMERVLSPVLGRCAVVYIDDIIIFSATIASHWTHLEEVLSLLQNANLKLNGEKCRFLQTSTSFLGFVVSGNGISTNNTKIQALLEFPRPTSVKQIREFLGVANYYRRFIQNFAHTAAPLHRLTSTQTFSWPDDAEKAFQHLKAALTSAPVLAFPNFSLPFILQTDASNVALGAVLSQITSDGEHPIAFISRILHGPETRYATTELECLAIVWAVTTFRHYLMGNQFTVITDHAALSWLMTNRDSSRKLIRWSLILQEHDFTIKFRAGSLNNADALSRNPVAVAANTLFFHLKAPRPLDITEDTEFLRYLSDEKIITSQPNRSRFTLLSKLYFIHEGQLFRKPENSLPARPVPKVAARSTIISDAHLLTAHASWSIVLKMIKRCYFWPGMSIDTKLLVRACMACQAMNKAANPDPRNLPASAKAIFERVGLDLIGPLPITPSGNCYIAVATDLASRYAEAAPMPNKTAQSVVRFLLSNLILRHGFPKEILSDNGKEFCNALVDAFCDHFAITHALASPYSPQTNGLVERTNGSLIQRIAKMSITTEEPWDHLLQSVVFGYNCTPHTALDSYSPYEIFYGRPPQLLGYPLGHQDNQYWDSLYAKRRSTKNTPTRPYIESIHRPGDLVLIRNHTPNTKFAPRWLGPFIVDDLLGGGGVKTVSLDGKTSKVTHRNDIKPLAQLVEGDQHINP